MTINEHGSSPVKSAPGAPTDGLEPGVALIAGVTGISGSALARELIAKGWVVYGISRRPPVGMPEVRHVPVDLLDAAATAAALRGLPITDLFFNTWLRQPTEADSIRVNGALLRNSIQGIDASAPLRHVALVTGLKHYIGPFEVQAYFTPVTPFRESHDRLEFPNFYYEQEDILFEESNKRGFTWNVHRPHTLIGFALGNLMNMGVTLALYGAICRATGRKFSFPGSEAQWNGLTDVTDARMLARHLEWAATTPEAANQAFNIVNGDVFRWSQLWPILAEDLGVEPEGWSEDRQTLVEQMADAADVLSLIHI